MPEKTLSARAARGPYAKSSSTRQRIVDAAVVVFSQHGYAGGTTAAIATVAGVSHPHLFYYFASKQELLMAVLDDRDRIADEIIDQIPTDPAAIPSAIVRIAISNESIPAMIRLYMVLFAEASADDHPLSDHYRDRYRRLEREFRAAFVLMQDAGLLAEGVDADYAGASTLALWDGLQLQWLIEPDRVDVVSHLRRHLETITRVRMEER